MSLVDQVQHGGAVRTLDDEGGDPKVAAAGRRNGEADRLVDAVREPAEARWTQVPVGDGRVQGCSDMELPEPAVLEDARTRLSRPLWRWSSRVASC